MSKAESSSSFKTWEEVILDFFETRISTTKLFKARKFIEKKEKEIASEKDHKKSEQQIKSRNKKITELAELKKEAPSTEIRKWIDATSKKNLKEGRRIIKVTHALKFSHGSALPDGLNYKKKCNKPILSTGSLKRNLVYDFAHSNGNLISISRFLALSLNDQQVIDLILSNDFSFLKPFTNNSNQRETWEKGFSILVEERVIKTGDKAKQIYFPNKSNPEPDKDYDLIIPLFSSSLAEKIYSLETDIKFGKEHSEIVKAKKDKGKDSKNSRYHPGIAVKIPNLGVFKFGGAQPQNISMLNKSRSWKADKKDRTTYGITYLFHTSPPTWQSQLKPPIYRQSLFSNLYNAIIKTEIDYLRDFLLRFKQLDLSIKDPKRKRHLNRWVDNIIDEFLFYIASIENLPAGWSATDGVRLKVEHQYLLDPYRSDESFQAARQNRDWQKVIQDDFSKWINRQLRGGDSQFTPKSEHSRLWKRLLEQPLREHIEQTEQVIKQKEGEVI